MINYISRKIIPLLTGQYREPALFITHAFYLNSMHLLNSIQKSLKYINGKVLDIGSGTSQYKKFFINNIDEYIALDNEETNQVMFPTSKEKFISGDIKRLPFNNDSFDTVLLTQVLEHIDDTNLAMQEVKRVLKVDGILIISVPFIYQSHAVPYDFYRFSEYGLKKILNDFEILDWHYQGYFGTTIISLINGFLWNISSKNKVLRNTILLPFILLIFMFNNIVGKILDLIKVRDFCPNFWVIARLKVI